MTTYNHERFIRQAITSVLAQRTNFPIELVVGDDASSDNTSRHIEDLRAQAPGVIRPTMRPTNIGVRKNLKDVLGKCHGQFIAFFDGDDYWTSEEKLQLQVDALRARDNAIGVFHPADVVDSLGRKMWTTYPGEVAMEIGTQELLERYQEVYIPTSSVMMRRDALVNLLNLPDRYQRLLIDDWPMWIHASLLGPWLCFPKVMSAYRHHDGAFWSPLSVEERLRHKIELFKAFAIELPQPFPISARRQLVQLHLVALEKTLECDQTADARRECREIVRLLPYSRMRDGRRLVNALWRTLSPRTHRVAQWAFRLIKRSIRNWLSSPCRPRSQT